MTRDDAAGVDAVAHELRNLLTVIRWNARALLADLPVDAKGRAELVQIEQHAERASALSARLCSPPPELVFEHPTQRYQTRPRAVGGPAGTPATILLVEDDASVRRLLRRGLESHGYAVLEAASAEAGLELARERGPEIALLITDVVMPGGRGGLLLAERVRETAPDVGVLYVTGAPSHERPRLEPGTRDRVLLKPFALDDLLHQARAVLETPRAVLETPR